MLLIFASSWICLVLFSPPGVQGSCPILYTPPGSNMTNITLQGLRLYLDLTDEELSGIPSSLIAFGNPDGTLDIIDDGELQGVFGARDLILLTPPIPSVTVTTIPIYLQASQNVYYSLSILAIDEDGVLDSFTDVYPNAEPVYPGTVAEMNINFCCKKNGTVLLQGCLTVASEPYTQLYEGSHLTLSPFYARYQCTVPDPPKECPQSFSITSAKVKWCFSSDQIKDLILSNQEGFGVIGRVQSTFCLVTNTGVSRFLSDETSSSKLPIGPSFETLDFYFNRQLEEIFNWTSPTYYSMSYTPKNTTVLSSLNSSIPLEGTFDKDEIEFTMFLPCLTNGNTFIEGQFNTSGLIDDYVVNNTYTFLFYKICMLNDSTDSADDSDPNSELVISLSVSLPLVIIIAVVLTISILLVCGIRQKRQVAVLEQLTAGESASYNTYAFASNFDPFDFLEDQQLEYNYAAMEVTDRLGEGFFGTVYKAIAPGLNGVAGEFVAVKTLKDTSNHSSLTEFAKELKVCMKFDHPNIIKLLGVCTESFEKCMIFEFMDLGSLDHCLRASNPDDEDFDPSRFIVSKRDFLPIVLQLAKALDYLSRLNFVHRDIAARNCLLNTQLIAKIADFGLSRNLNAQNYYKIGGGKKSYLPIRWMPPEAILYGKFTIKSDVWSFGILMWEIYTFSQLPYTGLSNHEVIDFIKERRTMNKPTDCPNTVYDVMRSTWTTVPSQRPGISEVVRRLQLFSEGKTDETMDYVNLNPSNT